MIVLFSIGLAVLVVGSLTLFHFFVVEPHWRKRPKSNRKALWKENVIHNKVPLNHRGLVPGTEGEDLPYLHTVTGRLSAKEPNIANSPKPAPEYSGTHVGKFEAKVVNIQNWPRPTPNQDEERASDLVIASVETPYVHPEPDMHTHHMHSDYDSSSHHDSHSSDHSSGSSFDGGFSGSDSGGSSGEW